MRSATPLSSRLLYRTAGLGARAGVEGIVAELAKQDRILFLGGGGGRSSKLNTQSREGSAAEKRRSKTGLYRKWNGKFVPVLHLFYFVQSSDITFLYLYRPTSLGMVA